MVAYVFQRLLDRGAPSAMKNVATAQDWFADNAVRVSENQMMRGGGVLSGRLSVGQLCMFSYDPKTKEKLPYYDRFPLVFPIDSRNGSFLGLNMHYLRPELRATLMDALWNYVDDDKLSAGARLQLTYNTLKAAGRLRYYKPCIKRYLNSNIRSRFVQIDPKQWNMALFLPTERFQKASKNKVYRDSQEKV